MTPRGVYNAAGFRTGSLRPRQPDGFVRPSLEAGVRSGPIPVNGYPIGESSVEGGRIMNRRRCWLRGRAMDARPAGFRPPRGCAVLCVFALPASVVEPSAR